MRISFTNSNHAKKLATLTCVTQVLIQSTAGTGTILKISSSKSDLEDLGTAPRKGLSIDPASGVYSFCWKGDMYAIAVGGTMFADLEVMS